MLNVLLERFQNIFLGQIKAYINMLITSFRQLRQSMVKSTIYVHVHIYTYNYNYTGGCQWIESFITIQRVYHTLEVAALELPTCTYISQIIAIRKHTVGSLFREYMTCAWS